MRRKAQISIYSDKKVRITELVDKFKVYNEIEITNLNTILFFENIYTDTEIYQLLMEEIKTLDLKYRFIEAREYTKREINTAEFFNVNIPFPWEHDPEKDAKFYGTQYKYPDGLKCECQREQVSELLVDVKKVGKNHFVEIIPEYIVSEFAMKVIQDVGLTGCIFKPAVDYKNRETQKIYQLIVTSILPPISNSIRVEIEDNPNSVEGCEYCSKKTYLRSEMIYNTEDVIEAKDFNLSLEHFDNGMNSKLVVRSKVREIFNKNKIRVYGYEPVSLI